MVQKMIQIRMYNPYVLYGHHIRTKQFNESLFIKNDFKPKKAKFSLTFLRVFQFVNDVKCWAQHHRRIQKLLLPLVAPSSSQSSFPTEYTSKHFTVTKHAPKAFENLADLAQAAKDYGGDTWREQLSYITQTGSAGQKACLREEGLSTSNITPAFLDAAKDILKKN
ncbi:hypothetical protein PROFUN_15223 [Planoprotostelium fungivorum]|uniref:Uncharacterized protein n=1 Tax=Planoprotostelium fungivorum TaxID=1890364 RepID=A0A2P6MWS4_9EUKA|nr:hypothetical protein PROFUN_15223 [Planoprotostelium fungivorum]